MIRPAAFWLLFVAACSGAAALFLAAQHPLFPNLLAAAAVVWALAVQRWPMLWLTAVPALLPVANWLPWTGWTMVEEFDLLLLATAAGGYLGLARREAKGSGPGLAAWPEDWRRWLPALLVVSVVALVRGFADAGSWQLDGFAAYQDAGNGWRVFKGPFLALLLAPLLRQVFADAPGEAVTRLATGMCLGLGITAILALLERASYPGLLDFSTHYRVTAWFWEMHVGGAAIDGYLALAVPFAGWALLESRGSRRWWLGATLVLATGYLAMTTFSRGVYLGLAAGLVLLVWWRLRRPAATTLAAQLPANARLAMAAIGLLAVDGAFSVAGYVGIGVLLLLVAAVQWRFWRGRLGGFGALRLQGGLLLYLLLTGELVAVLQGGSFLVTRLMAGQQDFDSRVGHWQAGVRLLQSPSDLLLGIGMGRIPARLSAQPDHDLPTAFRWRQEAGRAFVEIAGPPVDSGLGGLFGMGQRLYLDPATHYRVGFDLRAPGGALVQARLCEMHLLYDAVCQVATFQTGTGSDRWRRVALPFRGDRLEGGVVFAPRPAIFSLRVVGEGQTAEVGRVELAGGGRQWLANGDFHQGLARWFLTGQYYFLPWHIDNWPLELVLDQGLVGLVVLAGVLFAAFGRLREAAGEPLAPFLAASLGSYLMVGLFSSLMDAPRGAFLFLLLCFVSTLLPICSDSGHGPDKAMG